MTKLGPKRVHEVRVRGGNLKHRAMRLDSGNFAWGSEHVTRKTRIIDVVCTLSIKLVLAEREGAGSDDSVFFYHRFTTLPTTSCSEPRLWLRVLSSKLMLLRSVNGTSLT